VKVRLRQDAPLESEDGKVDRLSMHQGFNFYFCNWGAELWRKFIPLRKLLLRKNPDKNFVLY
jgi:hypothetical protein